jgi:GTP cyclohydrolase I
MVEKITPKEQVILHREVEEACENLLTALRIDWKNDHNTSDTPGRMAHMFISEVFKGRYEPMPDITTFPNVNNIDQIYTVGPITVRSACSHHVVPMMGQAWIGILPHKDGRIMGLSKFHRLTEWIFARPQIQEEATDQLGKLLEKTLHPRGLALVVRAEHFCMVWRGVRDPGTTMTSSFMRGVFKDDGNARNEFFNLIKGQGY